MAKRKAGGFNFRKVKPVDIEDVEFVECSGIAFYFHPDRANNKPKVSATYVLGKNDGQGGVEWVDQITINLPPNQSKTAFKRNLPANKLFFTLKNIGDRIAELRNIVPGDATDELEEDPDGL